MFEKKHDCQKLLKNQNFQIIHLTNNTWDTHPSANYTPIGNTGYDKLSTGSYT